MKTTAMCKNDRTFGLSILIRKNPAPQTFRSPDARAQAFELNDLAVVHEKVHFGSIVLDVPGENVWVSGFKHQFVSGKARSVL